MEHIPTPLPPERMGTNINEADGRAVSPKERRSAPRAVGFESSGAELLPFPSLRISCLPSRKTFNENDVGSVLVLAGGTSTILLFMVSFTRTVMSNFETGSVRSRLHASQPSRY